VRRTHKALATLALGLALATATTAAAAATPPTGAQDQADQRKALYQSELERNLQQRTKGSPRNCADKWDGDQAAAGRTV
jgi:hypothetical protein